MKIILKIKILVLIILFSSCKKDGLINRAEHPSMTRVLFVHAGPTSMQFNFFVNNIKLTGAIATADGLGQGMAYSTANLPSYFGYSSVEPGEATIQAISPPSSINPAPGSVLMTLNQAFDLNKSYSIFTYDDSSQLAGLMFEDKLVIGKGKGGIRFVNLMPGTISVDLEMSYMPPGSTTPVVEKFASNIPFMGVEGFKELEPNTYTFQRKRTGTNTLVGSALTITRLKNNQNFTLCARGTTAALLQVPHQ